MSGQLFDVDHCQIRSRQHTRRRQQGQVGVVLVVDRVVLIALDQPEQMRNLDAHPTGVGNQRLADPC